MIDMHLHTVWSDGELTPAELSKRLSENDITHAVLTDHDCVLGNDDFKKYCNRLDIKTIEGCELEGFYDVDNSCYLHMLCYDFKDKEELNRFLEEEREKRIKGIKEAISNLSNKGIIVSFEEVKNMSCGRHLLLNHLCMLLEKKGYVDSRFKAYQNFLDDGSKDRINYPKTTVEELLTEIKKVDGKAVLAHPKRIKMNNQDKEKYVKYLKELGLFGIEGYYSFDSKEERKFSNYLAEKYDLISTVGSDWHTPKEQIGFGNDFVEEKHVKKLVRRFFYE